MAAESPELIGQTVQSYHRELSEQEMLATVDGLENFDQIDLKARVLFSKIAGVELEFGAGLLSPVPVSQSKNRLGKVKQSDNVCDGARGLEVARPQ